MPPQYVYPTSQELQTIDPVLMAENMDADPIFREFPREFSDYPDLAWEQRDNYLGMTQFRGYNAPARRVERVGSKRHRMEPGVYGEFIEIAEEEMTRRAQPGTWATTINVGDLVTDARDQLMYRQTNRTIWVGWQLLTTGYYIVPTREGAIGHADAVGIQVITPAVPFDTHATAAVLGTFRALKLLSRGQSAAFNSTATAYMNTETANDIYANTNANDLGGKRADGLSSVDGLAGANRVLAREDLPRIEEYEGGYYDDDGTFQLHLPYKTIVVVGRRTNGARIGAWRFTRNMVNGRAGSSQPYVRVVEKGMAEGEDPPPMIRVHRGFNGGPVLYYPGSIVVIKY